MSGPDLKAASGKGKADDKRDWGYRRDLV